ncbi:MAG: hypothetical protein A3E80_04365 [Chlamydiae bacterium RIFCSPHIGHO2_12_FULL_49_9]|nr:MAG: hypothetical protein A3E80_04365 [Chlamydiae bacterium RIFCSPHIGHO2_12_FULL_49_9]
MYYYIDGYNLIFSLIDSKRSLQTVRETLVHFLQKKFTKCKLSGTLVFDGSFKAGEESGHSYPSPPVVVFTPEGTSADEYIVDRIEQAKNRKLITVITNDRGLILHVKSAGANVQNNLDFIETLEKWSKKKKRSKTDPVDTQHNIDRLQKIFEERLKNNPDE